MLPTGPRVSLDRDCEPWLGRWTGIGDVRVFADGTYEVLPDPNADRPEQVDAALRFGWAELLSNARRGLWAANGATVVPSDRSGALLLSGDGHDTALILLGLVAAGWSVMADRPAPLEFTTDSVHAHPSARPVVVSRRRARRMGFDGPSVRHGSDAIRLDDLPRATDPAPVDAIIAVRRRRLNEQVLTPVRGHGAIELLGKVLHHAALAPDTGDTPAAALARRLVLARAAVAYLAIDTAAPGEAITRLVDLWDAR